jgi:hypothetical protein
MIKSIHQYEIHQLFFLNFYNNKCFSIFNVLCLNKVFVSLLNCLNFMVRPETYESIFFDSLMGYIVNKSLFSFVYPVFLFFSYCVAFCNLQYNFQLLIVLYKYIFTSTAIS